MTERTVPEPHRPQQAVSYRTVLKHPNVRILAASRAFYKLGLATLAYGAMVYLAREGASQLQIALVSSSSYLAALLFGFHGGLVSDSMAKRLAISIGFGAQAALCFLIPAFIGTDVGALMILVFLATIIGQVVGPGLKAAVALVSNSEEIATTGALVSVLGSVASAAGSALLAPLLIKTTNLDVLLYVVAVLFAFGAIRALKIPEDQPAVEDELSSATARKGDKPSLRSTLKWLLEDRALASIILLGAIVTALYEVFTTMMPVYVRDVLNADPANSIYIFAPASIGFLVGSLGGPWFFARFGEKRVLSAAVILTAFGLVGFGMIGVIAPIFAPFNPLRLLGIFDIELTTPVLAAGVIAIPANLGSSLSSASVQVYINRHVASTMQGRLFGVQDFTRNALNIVTVLAAGGLAGLMRLEFVFLVIPAVVLLIILRIIVRLVQHTAGERMTNREAWGALLGRQRVVPVTEPTDQ